MKIHNLNIFIPKSPIDQVFDSIDIDFHSKNQSKLKPENFFNIIKNKNLSEIRSNWDSSLLNENYNYFKNKTFLIEIKSNELFYQGILCGISSKILKKELVIPHEKVFKKRVDKLKNYLDIVKIQAEPVVFGTSFPKEINTLIKLSSKNKAILDFKYKNFNYSIKKLNLIDSINNFSKFYIVDGHHRTSSFKSFSKNSKKEFKLLTFLIDVKNIKTDKYTWEVIKPSRNIVNSLKKLKKSSFKPDSELFWAIYEDEYYVFDRTDLGKLSIINLEKWIMKFGDKIKRYHDIKNKKYDNSIIFNYPIFSFNQIIDSINKQGVFPQKSTFLEPKMITGLTISELV